MRLKGISQQPGPSRTPGLYLEPQRCDEAVLKHCEEPKPKQGVIMDANNKFGAGRVARCSLACTLGTLV